MLSSAKSLSSGFVIAFLRGQLIIWTRIRIPPYIVYLLGVIIAFLHEQFIFWSRIQIPPHRVFLLEL